MILNDRLPSTWWLGAPLAALALCMAVLVPLAAAWSGRLAEVPWVNEAEVLLLIVAAAGALRLACTARVAAWARVLYLAFAAASVALMGEDTRWVYHLFATPVDGPLYDAWHTAAAWVRRAMQALFPFLCIVAPPVLMAQGAYRRGSVAWHAMPRLEAAPAAAIATIGWLLAIGAAPAWDRGWHETAASIAGFFAAYALVLWVLVLDRRVRLTPATADDTLSAGVADGPDLARVRAIVSETLVKARNAWHSPDGYRRARDFAFAKTWYRVPMPIRKRLAAGDHECPVCESHVRRFLVLHRASQHFCPVCRSMQRQRLVLIFLRKMTDLFDGTPKRFLHIAPEPSLTPRLSSIPGVDYLSADLMDPTAMVRMDITDIQYEEGTFDAVYCSHVLEHVPADRRAMREMCRVLKPGGWALILVPVQGETTYEDDAITTPEERERAFGQYDHVRYYGLDCRNRLADAGFEVSVYTREDFAGDDIDRMGLDSGQVFFFCRKPARPAEPSPGAACLEAIGFA